MRTSPYDMGRVDISQLETFLAVTNVGRFTEAAEHLYVSQSALSKRIAKLEDELGVDLFKNTHEGTELTQSGWQLYSYARRAVREYHEMINTMTIHEYDQHKTINFGVLPLAQEYGLETALSWYWVNNPRVQLEYKERSQRHLLVSLRIPVVHPCAPGRCG